MKFKVLFYKVMDATREWSDFYFSDLPGWFIVDDINGSHGWDEVVRPGTSCDWISLEAREAHWCLVPEDQGGDDRVQDSLTSGGGCDRLPHGGDEAEYGAEV